MTTIVNDHPEEMNVSSPSSNMRRSKCPVWAPGLQRSKPGAPCCWPAVPSRRSIALFKQTRGAPRLLALPLIALGAVLGAALIARSAETPAFTAFCPGGAEVVVTGAGGDYLRFGTAAWGPNWAWTGVNGRAQSEDDAAVGRFTATVGGVPLQLDFRASRPAANQLELIYAVSTEKDAALTLLVAELTPGRTFQGTDVVVESPEGNSTVRCPFGIRLLGGQVSALLLRDAGGAETRVTFDPPCEISADGAARIVLAKERFPAGTTRRLKITVDLPGATEWFPSVAEMPDEPGIADWYPFTPENTSEPGAIGMDDWLEKPAGKQGRIRRLDDALVYGGKPIKLWGLNLCYGACSPDHELADRRAAFYAKYGINSVRLHKFADGTGWAGIQSEESAAEYDPVGLERMDYQVAQFKEAGIYVKLSAHFGTIKLGPDDVRDVPFLEEFGRFEGRKNRVSAPHSAFFYSPELQNLHIRQIVNLLRHRNPHTGLTYAEDPAVFAIEIINEQSIFFYTSMAPLKESPTIRRQVGERFSDWLRARYGSHEGLLKAWGENSPDGFEKDGFPAGEHLGKRNILPLGNPWYWDPAQLEGSLAHRRQRLLDTLRFLYELQCEAYDRYVAAVREAGYDGEILGSNWQAGRALSHYANLHSDARVGLIDRHNYFGGNRGGTGKLAADSMLARAGSGSLSSGLQQVGDRPFMLSEWIHVFPNEWGVEGPAILAAYGLGLQGWDVSYLFQNGDNAAFSRQLGGQAWDVMAPQVLGIFPAVARQVLRGDVTESAAVAVRRVHVPSLFEGRLGFEDQVAQGYDDKELDGSQVPARSLAVARCTVDFTDDPQRTPAFDLKPFQQDGFLVSATGQLRWKEGGGSTDGFYTMNTPGTKAVVGFAEGQVCALDEVTITPRSRFAAIYVTAADKDGAVATSKSLLVVAMARARNTGMKFNRAGDELLDKGRGPVLLEPVQATLQIQRPGVCTVYLLDHDGRRTGRTLSATGGLLELDGARDRTPYYELAFE